MFGGVPLGDVTGVIEEMGSALGYVATVSGLGAIVVETIVGTVGFLVVLALSTLF